MSIGIIQGDKKMNIKSQKDLFSGLMFTSVGVAFGWGASTYSIGSGSSMGPGYFPLILGIVLAVLGVAITAKALVVTTEDGEAIGKFAWKPLFFIIAANLVFGAAIGGLPLIGLPPLGLIVGIYLLALVASAGGEEFKLKEVAILATVLALISYLAFIVVLKLQFPVWPAFIAG